VDGEICQPMKAMHATGINISVGVKQGLRWKEGGSKGNFFSFSSYSNMTGLK